MDEDLNSLSQADLIELIIKLIKKIRVLEVEILRIKKSLE